MISLKFRPGEIVTCKKDIATTRKGKSTYYIDGKTRRLNTYCIPSVTGPLPFLKGLLRKRFVITYNEEHIFDDYRRGYLPDNSVISTSVGVYLMDNYKPGFYDAGWRFVVNSLDIFESTGTIELDYRKLPHFAQEVILGRVQNNNIPNKKIRSDGNNLLEKLVFHRRLPTRVFSKDLFKVYSILNGIGNRCRNCANHLDSQNIVHIDLLNDAIDFRKIRKKVLSMYLSCPPQPVHIFPVGYECSICDQLNVLVSTDSELLYFSSYCVGPSISFYKDN